MKHVDDAEVLALLNRWLDFDRALDVFSHLLLCRRCRTRKREAVDPEELDAFMRSFGASTSDPHHLVQDQPDRYDELRRLLREWSRQHRDAKARMDYGLAEMPTERLKLLCRNIAPIPLAAVLQCVHEECRRLFHVDPQAAERLARAGLEILRERAKERLDRSFHVLLMADLGNALRIQGRLREAVWVLQQAKKGERQVRDPFARGLVLRFLAIALADWRRYKEAAESARASERTFLSINEVLEASRATFIFGLVLARLEEYEESSQVLASLETSSLDQGLLFSVEYRLTKNYLQSGQAWRAAREMRRVRAFRGIGRLDKIRVDWLDALIRENLNQVEDAFRLLERVARTLKNEGQLAEAACAGLDMLRLGLKIGQARKALTYLRNLRLILRTTLHVEVARALQQLSEEVTEDFLHRVRRFIGEASRDPGYTLEEAGLA